MSIKGLTQRRSVDLSRPHSPRIEIHRAREVVSILPRPSMDVQASKHPIIASWPVIHFRAPKMNVCPPEPPSSLIVNLTPANLDRIVDRESMAVSPIVFAATIVGPVPVVVVISICRRRRRRTALIVAPEDIERIPLRAAVRIVNRDYSRA